MSDLTSALGVPEPSNNRIVSILDILPESFEGRWCTTRITTTDDRVLDAKRVPVRVYVYKIDDPRTLGYIPSKCWSDSHGRIHLMFYVSPSLPTTARPHGNQPFYMFMYPALPERTIHYDGDARLFIDQVKVGDEMMHMFIFSENEATQLLDAAWDGRSWAEANPIVSEWDALAKQEGSN